MIKIKNHLILFFSIVMALMVPSIDTGATVLNVPVPYTTIQSALDAAVNGDQILVDNGTYVEGVIITNVITLQGTNKYTTIINASGTSSNAVSIYTNGVIVQGFTIISTNMSAIFVTNSDNCVITDNVISNSLYGIYLIGTVTNASVTGVLAFVTNAFITTNDIKYNSYGIYSATNSRTHNIIRSSILSNSIYNVYNYTTNRIFVRSNYWGTAVYPTITSLNFTAGSYSFSVSNAPYYVDTNLTILNTNLTSTVWVDDDYTDGNASNHIYYYDAFPLIQMAITNLANSGTVYVAKGVYTNRIALTTKSAYLYGAQAGVDARFRTNALSEESVIQGLIPAGNLFSGPTTVGREFVLDGFYFDGYDGIAPELTTWSTITTARKNIMENNIFNRLGLINISSPADTPMSYFRFNVCTNFSNQLNYGDNTYNYMFESNVITTTFTGFFFGNTSHTNLFFSHNEIYDMIGYAFFFVGINSDIYINNNDIARVNTSNSSAPFNFWFDPSYPMTDFNIMSNTVIDSLGGINVSSNYSNGEILDFYIMYNSFLNCEGDWFVRFSGTGVLDVAGNYWGTTNQASIEANMTNLANMIYLPYYLDTNMVSFFTNYVPQNIFVDTNYHSGHLRKHFYGWDAFSNIVSAAPYVPSTGTMTVYDGVYSFDAITIQGLLRRPTDIAY